MRGDTLFPPTFLNRFHILLAILRQIHLVIVITFFSDELYNLKPDVFVVDQLSACVPLLRWLYPRRQRILFYCHFPDQLLADRGLKGIGGSLKKTYRLPFDWFEGWSMRGSDKVVVNSKFTKSVASQIFPSLTSTIGIIYPCVDGPKEEQSDSSQALWNGKFRILLSINRFERKKDIGLALKAYSGLISSERQSTRLVLAGGYDNRVSENVQFHAELVQMAEKLGFITGTAKTVPTALGIPDTVQVLFLLSVPGPFKTTLLENAKLLLYTPSNEHFGIVPVEAMMHGVPVLASNTGGPLETVVEGKTGWLRSVTKTDEWTAVIRNVLSSMNEAQVAKMKTAGQARVREHFSRPIMAQKFETEIRSMAENRRSSFTKSKDILMALGVVAAFLVALIAVIVRARFAGKGDKRLSEFARARRSKQATGSDTDIKFNTFQIF